MKISARKTYSKLLNLFSFNCVSLLSNWFCKRCFAMPIFGLFAIVLFIVHFCTLKPTVLFVKTELVQECEFQLQKRKLCDFY